MFQYPFKELKYGADVFSGFAFKSSDFSDNGIPVVKIKNIQNRFVELDEIQYFPPEKINKKHTKFFLENDDVLIAMTGQGSLGRVGRIKINKGDQALVNQRVGKFVTDEENLHLDYLYYVLSSKQYEKILFDRGTGSGQPNLSPDIILGTEIPFPPFKIQKKIAFLLNSINSKIELNKQINQNLKLQLESLFISWFFNFDIFSEDDFEDSEFGKILKEWKIVSLGEITTRIKDKVGTQELKVLSAVNSGKLQLSEEYFSKQVFSKNF